MGDLTLSRSPKGLSLLANCLFRESPFFKRTIQRFRPYICPFEEIIDLVPGKSDVLDIGCGCGSLIGMLASFKILRGAAGLDTDPGAIAEANLMAKSISQKVNCQNIEFFNLSLNEFAKTDRKFSVVLMIDVIHHIHPEKQKEFINLAMRFLRPNGLLIYKDMCQKPSWKAFANRVHDLIMAKQWIHYLPIEKAIEFVLDQNFKLVKRKDYTNFCFGHELCIFKNSNE